MLFRIYIVNRQTAKKRFMMRGRVDRRFRAGLKRRLGYVSEGNGRKNDIIDANFEISNDVMCMKHKERCFMWHIKLHSTLENQT